MVESSATQIALLSERLSSLRDELKESEKECKERDDAAMQRIRSLEKTIAEYKAKADRAGYVAIGFVAAGFLIIGTVASAREKLSKLLIWLFT